MGNIEILDLHHDSVELKMHYEEPYFIFKNKFHNVVEERFEKFNELFGCGLSFDFDILEDFSHRNTKIIINNVHMNHLNLFKFNIILNFFNNEIKEYILNDNILQLASFSNIKDETLFDLKSDMLAELNEITNILNSEAIFNIFTDFSIFTYDLKNNTDSFIKIHVENSFLCNHRLFNNNLDQFMKKFKHCSLQYQPNEICFGSYLRKNLNNLEFNKIKLIRDKGPSMFAVYYDDIDDLGLIAKIKNILRNRKFTDSRCFVFNDV